MKCRYHCFGLVLGCATETSKDSGAQPMDSPADVVDNDPQCVNATLSQVDLWQRLGSPLGNGQTEQFAPSLVAVEDGLWLYYSQRSNLNDVVYRITTQDGVSWSEPVAVSGLDQLSGIMNINVVQRGNSFSAAVGGGRIGFAESADGLTWTVTEIQGVPSATFDAYGQLYPAQDSSGERLWFSGFSGQTFAIGLATKTNGEWSNREAVINSDAQSEYANAAVGQSAIYHQDDTIFMWYGGYDTGQTDPGPWRILFAQSTDGIQWSPGELALDLTPSGEEAYSVREPSVALWNDILWMAYIGMGDDGQYRLRLASCE